MGIFAEPRKLKPNERELLEFLLTADFPGRDELKAQLQHVEVVGDCECGCGTIDLKVNEYPTRAFVEEPIPVEARGEGIEVLLFVRGGLLCSLEIVDYEDRRPLPYPSIRDLELWVTPARKPPASD
jgi:hypothetical protein